MREEEEDGLPNGIYLEFGIEGIGEFRVEIESMEQVYEA